MSSPEFTPGSDEQLDEGYRLVFEEFARLFYSQQAMRYRQDGEDRMMVELMSDGNDILAEQGVSILEARHMAATVSRTGYQHPEMISVMARNALGEQLMSYALRHDVDIDEYSMALGPDVSSPLHKLIDIWYPLEASMDDIAQCQRLLEAAEQKLTWPVFELE